MLITQGSELGLDYTGLREWLLRHKTEEKEGKTVRKKRGGPKGNKKRIRKIVREERGPSRRNKKIKC